MEEDTGAATSVILYDTYRQRFSNHIIQNTNVRLHSYTGGELQPSGTITMEAKYGSTCKKLPLFVVPNCGPPLLGRYWYRALNMYSQTGFSDAQRHFFATIEFSQLFNDGLGRFSKKVVTKLKNNYKSIVFPHSVLEFVLKN
ncbi:hypothetical protein PR048_026522 [Dryococelus australis]|uniref:Uncharacterized protein n=1 Tax=Dryococelus australis TaxID=614101 RepID=A0ABQ9GLJ8_9NEOP|nr:hypothetical protein PR048_026522 [Dryococelus australis]